MTSTLKLSGVTAFTGAIILSAVAIAPAVADEYPPTQDVKPQSHTEVQSSASNEEVAYTGTSFTGLGLVFGVAALGAGTGLVVASRRRKG